MEFRTPCLPPKLPLIEHGTPISFLGSCFSEHLATRLAYQGFDVCPPSHGILFDGFSMVRAMEHWTQKPKQRSFDLIAQHNVWYSWDHHGSFRSESKQNLLNSLNKACNRQSNMLKKAQVLFITLGTAWYFVLKESDRPVANCHKVPANRFERKLAEPHLLAEKLSNALNSLRRLNPKLEVVLSVSPVKHLRDGISGNLLSKSVLLLTSHMLTTELPFCSYFPGYELLTEDLRDYRFYAKDMAHPSEQAIDYIMEAFAGKAFSKETARIVGEVERFRKLEGHRPLANPKAHKTAIVEAKKQLLKAYPILSL